ncbi:MAG: hypothetical protein QXD32_03750 [Nitrososphaerota archaeon]
MRLKISGKAEEILERLRRERGELYMLLGFAGCCGASNIFISTNQPTAGYQKIGEREGLKIYIQPSFLQTLGGGGYIVDAVESEADDSFSAETSYGYRLILKPEQGP